MHLRTPAGKTLQEVRDELDTGEQTWEGPLSMLTVDVDQERPSLRFGAGNEVLLPSVGQEALAKFANVPVKFYQKLDPDEKQYVLSNRLNRFTNDEKDVVLRYTPDAFLGLHPTGQAYVPSHRVADTLLEVFPEDSEIIEYREEGSLFHIDVVHAVDSPHAGGDRQVNDITRGGVRVVLNRDKGTAPEVNPYLYRLICTNGMETQDRTLRIEGRGRNSNEILANLEFNTQQAIDSLSRRIDQFYALRQERVEGDPTQTMIRLAQERGLSPLVANRLALGLPADEDHTLFSLINRVTNYANHPDLESHPAQRRNLEIAGGTLATQHAERCSHCSQTLA